MVVQNKQSCEGFLKALKAIIGDYNSIKNSERAREILRRGDIRAEQIGLNSRFREEYINKRVNEIIANSDIRIKLLNYN